jgi:hypothetical protein
MMSEQLLIWQVHKERYPWYTVLAVLPIYDIASLALRVGRGGMKRSTGGVDKNTAAF